MSGGNTNLTELGTPLDPKSSVIYIQWEYSKPIINTSTSTIMVPAGTPLATVHEICISHNLQFPFDLSAQNAVCGGLISTAAGGNQSCIAEILENVTFIDGRGIERKICKQDIAQLYQGHSTFPTGIVGGQGLLGIICNATFKLKPLPQYQTTMIIPLNSLSSLQRILKSIQRNDLESCEIIHKNCLIAIDSISERQLKFKTEYALLIDWKSAHDTQELIIEHIFEALPDESSDIVLADNKVWKDRHHISDGARKYAQINNLHYKGFDLSIPKENFYQVITTLENKCLENNIMPFFFGHAVQQKHHIVMHCNMASTSLNIFSELNDTFHYLFTEKSVMSSGEHGGMSGDLQKLKNAYICAGEKKWIEFINLKKEYDPYCLFRKSLTTNAVYLLPKNQQAQFIDYLNQ